MKTITVKDLFTSLLSGVFLTLPFLNFSFSPLAWIALIPLIAAVVGKKSPNAFLLGLAAGIVFGFGGMYWLARVTAPGYAVLACYLALYPGCWTLFAGAVIRKRPGWFWWAAPAAWTALEFIRSFFLTGFPWNLLGISQVENIPLIQISAFTGVYGVSFLVALVNCSLAAFMISALRPRIRFLPGKAARFFPPAAAAILTAGAFLYGARELAADPVGGGWGKKITLSLVQGGILQDQKWDPTLASSHFRHYLDLSRRALTDRPDLVVWPESSLPYYPRQDVRIRKSLSGLARQGDADFIIGADTRFGSNPVGYYNSAYLFTPDGGMLARYDKIHLVPFGEYTPLKSILPFLGRVVPWESDFSPGTLPGIFKLTRPAAGNVRAGVLICYEDIFPAQVRKLVGQGADLLVNITNDAWYGRTIAPFQHAYAALFRAVENRIFLARATNTGYSCLIDPRGRIVADVADEKGKTLFISGFRTTRIGLSPPGTFYTRRGDLFSWVCAALTAAAIIGCLLPPRSGKHRQ